MPIITNSGNPRPSLNGNADGSMLSSLDDEESFVVLERSTANDVIERSTANNGVVDGIPHSSDTFQNLTNSSCSFPTFNNLATSGSPILNHSQVIPIESLALPFESTNISVSAEEIDKRLQDVLHENVNLKENLYQTNLAMKQQLNTVRLLQERALEVQKHHQSKFEETKALIIKLGSENTELQDSITSVKAELDQLKQENKDLQEANVTAVSEVANLTEENKELKETKLLFGTEGAKLLNENETLKMHLSAALENLHTASQHSKKPSLQPTPKECELHELVDQLTRKLEAVERARRQQEFDIDRFTAQLGRLSLELNESQRKLALSENALQLAQTPVVNENSLPFGEKVSRYDGLLKQFQASIQDEQIRFHSLNSWISMTDPSANLAQFEISELRRLLTEEQSHSVARKENLYQAISTIHELLGDFQKLGQELEKVRAAHAVQESHGLAYDEMQKKGFTEKIDSLTAKLVEKEEALAISDRHLASLQEAVRLQNDEKKDPFSFLGDYDNGQIQTLKEQVQLLTQEIATKDESLQTKTQEMNVLQMEIQNLRTTKDTISVLEEQAKIYQADFEAERKSRETLVAEKETILEDLRHLQRRNQELIEELSKIREMPGQTLPRVGTNTRREERSRSPAAPRPQDDVIPPPKRFYCPNPECNMMFTTLDPLQLHVITCLKLDD